MRNRRRSLSFDLMEVRITPSDLTPLAPPTPVADNSYHPLYPTTNPTTPDFTGSYFYEDPDSGTGDDDLGFTPVYYIEDVT